MIIGMARKKVFQELNLKGIQFTIYQYCQLQFLYIHNQSIIIMLKGLKKGGKDKKDVKKDSKTKNQEKKPQPTAEQEEEDNTTKLIDIDDEFTKKDDPKTKKEKKRKNEFKLQEKEIQVTNIDIQKKEQVKKPLTTWVANSVAEVTKKDFNMEEHDLAFTSLTDEAFNDQQRKKAKNLPKVQSVTDANGIMFKPLEKTKDQLLMEKADQSAVTFSKKPEQTNTIQLPDEKKQMKFVNSAANSNFMQIEKTPQELKMQQMEQEYEKKKEAEKNQKVSWMGAKKDTSNPPSEAASINFKKTPMIFTNSGMNNMKVIPLEQSNQEKKMMTRKEQEFNFLSKTELEERKRKREEKEKEKEGLKKGTE